MAQLVRAPARSALLSPGPVWATSSLTAGRGTIAARPEECGANTPWNLVRWAFGRGASATNFSIKVTGSKSRVSVPSAQACRNRYANRPSASSCRRSSASLRLRSDGRIALELKQAWHDGTRELVFEPLELLERLAAMTPRPETNLLICHRLLAARAR